MNKAIISMVVPVYKVEPYIERCLNSILTQTFREFDLVLVDDGSPDRCGEICERYILKFAEAHISCKVIHQKNGGLSAARNTGIEYSLSNSGSEWITFVDSDDWLHREYLSSLYQAVIHSELKLAIGNYDKVKSEDEACTNCIVSSEHTVESEEFWVENRTNATVAWGKLYKKSSLQSIRYPIGRYHEDEYITYRILFQYAKVAVVDAPIYHYFVNDSSIMAQSYLKRLPDLEGALQEHIDFLNNTNLKCAYRLEIEKYAECLSDAIWILCKEPFAHKKNAIHKLRSRLKRFLKDNKKMIPFEKRKDIYIAAYPSQQIFIRTIGWIKELIRTFNSILEVDIKR